MLENVRVLFDLAFPEGEDGDKARARVASALKISHDKECTVSRTIEAPTSVELIEKHLEPHWPVRACPARLCGAVSARHDASTKRNGEPAAHAPI